MEGSSRSIVRKREEIFRRVSRKTLNEMLLEGRNIKLNNSSEPSSPDFVLLDTRTDEEFKQCHIVSAISFPLRMLHQDKVPREMLLWKNELPIVIYSEGEDVVGIEFTKILVQRGFNHVHFLSHGLRKFARDFPFLIVGETPEHIKLPVKERPVEDRLLDYASKKRSENKNARMRHANCTRVEVESLGRQSIRGPSTFKQSPRWSQCAVYAEDRKRHKNILKNQE